MRTLKAASQYTRMATAWSARVRLLTYDWTLDGDLEGFLSWLICQLGNRLIRLGQPVHEELVVRDWQALKHLALCNDQLLDR
jgi:hypothetical protein